MRLSKQLLLLIISLWIIKANAQVTGLLLDRESRKPIPAVTISVDGKEKTKTNSLGNFSIENIEINAVLTFKHLSYVDTTIHFNAKSYKQQMIVLLQAKQNELKEVIVNTGYQNIPKHRLTGSFSTVNSEQLQQQISKGITTLLPAIASGVLMDNSSDFSGRLMVRGLSTIQGDKKPLIILDNFPYEGNIDDLNPLDIENVTILKDAAASAIWGVRAGNGVIVISTKKGKYFQRQTFNLSKSIKIGGIPDLNRLDIMNSKEFIELEEFLFEKKFYDSKIGDYAKSPLSPIVEALNHLRSKEINQVEYDVLKSSLSLIDVRDEYKRHFFSNSIFQQYHLQGNGGTERFAWISSIGYDKDISYNKNNGDRFTFGLNNQIKLLSKLNLSSDVNLAYLESSFGRPAFGDIKMSVSELYPYAQFANGSNEPLRISQRNNTYIDEIQKQGLLMDWNYYPLLDFNYVKNSEKKWLLNWNLGLKYNITEHLNLDVKYNLVLDNNNSDRLNKLESYASRNLINSFSSIDGNTGGITYNIPKGGILNRSDSHQIGHNARVQIDFNRSLGDHEIVGLLGFEGRINQLSSKGDILYGFNQNNLSFANVDYVTKFPDVTTGDLRVIPNGQYITGTDIRYASVFANVVYSFKRKVNLSGSVRRDATNLFGASTNKKWNLLWSVGGSWRVIDDVKSFVNGLNLRTTYGFSGNVDPTMSSVNTIRYMGTNFNNNLPIALFSSFANPDLKWESIGTLNIGSDLKLWNKRVDFTIDWYRKIGSDLYGLDINDPTAGIGPTIVKNVAKMQSNGLDLSLNIKAIQKNIWGLEFQFNLTKTKDKILQYYLKNNQGRNFINERAISGLEGKPVYSLFSYKWKGLDNNGNPIGYLDGKESQEYSKIYSNTQIGDMEYGGPVLPKWFGSGGATLNYSDFSLNFRLLYKLGHDMRTKSIDYTMLLSNNITHSDYEKRWKRAGDEVNTYVPALVYPLDSNREYFYKNSSILVEPASHIRLQYVNLQYSPFASNRFKVKYTLFMNVENLGIIWKETKKEIDPDFENLYNTIAPPRQWAFGLRLNF